MAGFLDKAKAVAQQALEEAKKGVETGQAKLDDVQAKKEASRVLAALGAAFYAEQRSGGPRSDVDAALKGVDEYVTVNGTSAFPSDQDPAPSPPPPAPTPATSPPPTPPAPPAPPPPGGGTSYDMPPSS